MQNSTRKKVESTPSGIWLTRQRPNCPLRPYVPAGPQQTCIYGSHMGHPVWSYPNGSHITAPIKKKIHVAWQPKWDPLHSLDGPQGGTLIFSHIRRLGPFFGVQNSEFQYFFGFSEK